MSATSPSDVEPRGRRTPVHEQPRPEPTAAAAGTVAVLLDRRGPALAAAVVAVAGALRLPWPSAWWLNPDEGIYYAAITRETFAGFWEEASATAHPPLYFLILRGVALLTTDLAWLRSVALVCGLAAVYAFIALGREVGGKGARGQIAGLLAGMLLAISPRAIALSQVMRPYMLLVLLLVSALLFLLRYRRTRSNGLLVAYAACVSLALTLHYSAAPALGVFGLVVAADGLPTGSRTPGWRRLALVQLVPGLTLVSMYFWHLRGLLSSVMADQALDGWLSSYMIRQPADAWLGLVGVHSSLVGDDLAVSAALLTVIGMAWAAAERRWTLPILAGSGVALAMAGALAGLYPMGASRHTSWLFVFLTPVLAWMLAVSLTPRLTRRPTARAVSVLLLAVLLVGAGPLSSLLDSDRRPREIAERVLRVAAVEAMGEVLDPQRGPRLVLMSTETYTLLTPLYARARQGAASTRDGLLLHFRWGRRDVIVLPGRDFSALPTELRGRNHLHGAIQRAVAELPVAGPAAGESVLVLAGGWRSQGMEDLAALARDLPALGSTMHVPGLIAVVLDYDVYRQALGQGAR